MFEDHKMWKQRNRRLADNVAAEAAQPQLHWRKAAARNSAAQHSREKTPQTIAGTAQARFCGHNAGKRGHNAGRQPPLSYAIL
eukprot:2590622-Rhodomonas_salina.1